MKATLISFSKPTRQLYDQGLYDAQDLIAYCARVSNPANQFNTATAEKLLGYLAKHKHWSPFEMVSACIEVETTRDIGRQLLRHRSFSFQEFSQRYADPTKDLEMVLREPRLQDEKNRQNSVEIDMTTDDGRRLAWMWEAQQIKVRDAAREAYSWAIEVGIAKEQARAVLPEGLMMSRLQVNGTIRSWIHYIELRSGNGTQKEHIQIAQACAQAITQAFPMISSYVESNT
jgi:thymidylate synthase (FAD)